MGWRMLYYNDDSGLSGVPLAPQRKRMSTHLLEDMTQAQRLELFLHHLPAQITSFPIGTEISSSTLCQQLTEELGVRLIDLNPFRDEVAQVARAVITRLQEAVEEENEEEAIESAVEDRGGAAPTVLGCSGLPHAPPPPASVFPPKWPSWKEGEPKRRKATGEPFGKGPYLWKKGGPKATVPSGYTRSAESRPSGGYTTANEVWDGLGRDSLEGLDLGRDSRCRTYRGTLRSGDARRGRAGGSQQASTPSLPRVWRRLLKKGHQTIAQSSSLPPSPKGRLAGEWACQSRSRTSYLRGRDHWRWCLHVPILDTSHRND
mmetsp:Transcript_10880/g.25046  ORF Transcript_10880/g.25046 Transcript_10880/m.25046 type:complete len:317 (+) Transcript_10880:504-1454(+)